MFTVARANRLRGTLHVPGDKSISHRAVILNGIAEGSAHITNLASGRDVSDTTAIMRRLGVRIEAGDRPNSLFIEGAGLRGLRSPTEELDAGNSGTGLRLISGVLAGAGLNATITGDDSLRTRPMLRIVKPLRMMGADVVGSGESQLAPLTFRGGRLRGIEYQLPVASAQVKSCVLLAGLFADGPTVIHQPGPSRDHSERMLTAMGADIESQDLVLTLRPSRLQAADVEVVGDISSALFWIVAAIVNDDAEINLPNVGVNPGRAAILDVLRNMGAAISVSRQRTVCGEPVAAITAKSGRLKGVDVDPQIIPQIVDEIPALAVAAAMADGATRITGAAELRHKESDRIAATCKWLGTCGVEVEERPDGFTVHGRGAISGGRCSSFGDHRIAMALAIAGTAASEPITIEGTEAVDSSYPEFWRDLERLSGGG